jgi:hypothetical protein
MRMTPVSIIPFLTLVVNTRSYSHRHIEEASVTSLDARSDITEKLLREPALMGAAAFVAPRLLQGCLHANNSNFERG